MRIDMNSPITGPDHFHIEILPDGTLKTVTDGVSAANHDSAEFFLRAMAKLAGGETTREARKDVKGHAHTHYHHGEEHVHGGH